MEQKDVNLTIYLGQNDGVLHIGGLSVRILQGMGQQFFYRLGTLKCPAPWHIEAKNANVLYVKLY